MYSHELHCTLAWVRPLNIERQAVASLLDMAVICIYSKHAKSRALYEISISSPSRRPRSQTDDLLPSRNAILSDSGPNTAREIRLKTSLASISQCLNLTRVTLCRDEPSSAGKAPLIRVDQVQEGRRVVRRSSNTTLSDASVLTVRHDPVCVLRIESRRLHVSRALSSDAGEVVDLVFEVA